MAGIPLAIFVRIAVGQRLLLLGHRISPFLGQGMSRQHDTAA
jgi:hypothetical protein